MTSRREEKEQRRAERLAREQQEMALAHRRRVYSIVVGGALGLAAIAAVVVAVAAGGGSDGGSAGMSPTGQSAAESYEGAIDPPPQTVTDLTEASAAADCTVRNPPIEGQTHVPPDEKVEYNTNQPNSGNHDVQPTADGVFAEEPNQRNLVHTMEHGRVEIFYTPSLEKRRKDQLGGLFNEDPYHMVLSPDTDMRYAVAATAWGHVLGCRRVKNETFDALRAFRDRYRDKGPEQVP